MLIEIRRLKSNRYYTEGVMYINDMHNTLTVECTEHMLTAGHYTLKLHNKNAHKRELLILDTPSNMKHGAHLHTGWKIGTAASWIGSKRKRTISIGQQLIPGALYKAAPIYERIIKRLEKCKERKEIIHLVINDEECSPTEPIRYWLEPSEHGCLSSKQRVEVDSKGNATIFEGDKVVKYLSIEQQLANRLTISTNSLPPIF